MGKQPMNAWSECDEGSSDGDLSNEWYTPSLYIEAARSVLGRIDLDPASCELANRVVKATTYYTQQDNGLLQPWYGRVWLNPPFGTTSVRDQKRHVRRRQSNIALFSRKLVASYQEGQVEQAIFLCRADPSTLWFPVLWQYPICFVAGSFYFDGPCGRGTRKHRFGTCFVYLGPREHMFIDVFRHFGRVAKAVDTPPPFPKAGTLWETEAVP